MTVFVLARVTPALRGKLTRWMLEIHPGVFVGTLSPRVRDGLWAIASRSRRHGACTMVARQANEQGFVLATSGDAERAVVDYDGLLMLRRPPFGERRRRPKGPDP